MLRIERTFEEAGIRDELEATGRWCRGSEWTATLLLEYPDEVARKHWLGRLKGVEDRVWVRVEGCEAVFAIADEDLERENDVKTSAVHFLRFPLDAGMVKAMREGASLAVGVDHPEYRAVLEAVPEPVRRSLCEDLTL